MPPPSVQAGRSVASHHSAPARGSVERLLYGNCRRHLSVRPVIARVVVPEKRYLDRGSRRNRIGNMEVHLPYARKARRQAPISNVRIIGDAARIKRYAWNTGRGQLTGRTHDVKKGAIDVPDAGSKQ